MTTRATYFGSMTFSVPTGRISIDFPQNLFFHLISKRHKQRIRNIMFKSKRFEYFAMDRDKHKKLLLSIKGIKLRELFMSLLFYYYNLWYFSSVGGIVT